MRLSRTVDIAYIKGLLDPNDSLWDIVDHSDKGIDASYNCWNCSAEKLISPCVIGQKCCTSYHGTPGHEGRRAF